MCLDYKPPRVPVVRDVFWHCCRRERVNFQFETMSHVVMNARYRKTLQPFIVAKSGNHRTPNRSILSSIKTEPVRDKFCCVFYFKFL